MAELSTLARPYAKAAFQAAVDAGEVQAWSDMLSYAGAVSEQRKWVLCYRTLL